MPDHHPNVPYAIRDVYEAARYILQYTAISNQEYYVPTQSIIPAPTTPISMQFLKPIANPIAVPEPIKADEVTSIFSKFSKSIVEVIQQNQCQSINCDHSHSHLSNSDLQCRFCGKPHLIQDCDLVTEYIQAGRCRRNIEGKVILPTGTFIPRDTPGHYLRDQINEWHNRNPNQLATATLGHTVDTKTVNRMPTQVQNSQPTFQLSTTDRIAVIEAELLSLRARKVSSTPEIYNRAQEESSTRKVEAVAPERNPSFRKVTEETQVIPSSQQPHCNPQQQQMFILKSQPISSPENSYQNANFAGYAPPSFPNFAAKEKKFKGQKEAIPAYKMSPPVHNTAIADQVFRRTLEIPVTITQEELQSIAPEIQSRVQEVATPRRMPIKDDPIEQNVYQLEEDEYQRFEKIPTVTTFANANTSPRESPEESSIVFSPVLLQYLPLRHEETVPEEEEDDYAIRSLFTLEDFSQNEEDIASIAPDEAEDRIIAPSVAPLVSEPIRTAEDDLDNQKVATDSSDDPEAISAETSKKNTETTNLQEPIPYSVVP